MPPTQIIITKGQNKITSMILKSFFCLFNLSTKLNHLLGNLNIKQSLDPTPVVPSVVTTSLLLCHLVCNISHFQHLFFSRLKTLL